MLVAIQANLKDLDNVRIVMLAGPIGGDMGRSGRECKSRGENARICQQGNAGRRVIQSIKT